MNIQGFTHKAPSSLDRLQLVQWPPPPSMVSLSEISVTCGQPWSENIQWKNPRNKRFISFKLHAIVSSMMKSRAIPLHPAQDMSHSVQLIHTVSATPAC